MPIMPEPHALASVRVAIGLEPGDNLPHDAYSRACTACDGWGKVETGSKVTAQATATCFDCKGKGWVAVGDERASGSITGGNGTLEAVPSPQLMTGEAEPPEAELLRANGFIVTKIPKIEPIIPV